MAVAFCVVSEPFNLGRNLREDLALNISSETEKAVTYGSDPYASPSPLF